MNRVWSISARARTWRSKSWPLMIARIAGYTGEIVHDLEQTRRYAPEADGCDEIALSLAGRRLSAWKKGLKRTYAEFAHLHAGLPQPR